MRFTHKPNRHYLRADNLYSVLLCRGFFVGIFFNRFCAKKLEMFIKSLFLLLIFFYLCSVLCCCSPIAKELETGLTENRKNYTGGEPYSLVKYTLKLKNERFIIRAKFTNANKDWIQSDFILPQEVKLNKITKKITYFADDGEYILGKKIKIWGIFPRIILDKHVILRASPEDAMLIMEWPASPMLIRATLLEKTEKHHKNLSFFSKFRTFKEELISMVLLLIISAAAVISVEVGLSVAIIEIFLGTLVGNFLGIRPAPWMMFLGGFGGIVLTFLAGAEVDSATIRRMLKETLLIGILSFLLPFLGVFSFCYFLWGWPYDASVIAGIALSTTSLAVVYAVLVETGLTNSEIGKIIMASTFVTDFGVVLALSGFFAELSWYTLIFMGVSAAVIALTVIFAPWIFKRYGQRIIEPEIKFLFAVLLVFVYFSKLGATEALLPAFILGLLLSKTFSTNQTLRRRLASVSFAIITPFFFINSGMNISLKLLILNAAVFGILFGIKIATKFMGVYPLARKFVPKASIYTTLLMSTGLTMGTIASTFGLSTGRIDQAQFSVLVGVVVMSAIVPTIIAQLWFQPTLQPDRSEEGGSLEVKKSLK